MNESALPPGLIINADDLGIHPQINAGILSAYRNGILTSCTMLMTTDFFEETVRDYVRTAALPIGIHLSLTIGKAAAPLREVPDLIDDEGNLRLTASQLLLSSFIGSRGPTLLRQIEREFEAQISRAIDVGIQATHADSHQHVHMNPAIFKILEGLLPRFGIKRMRLSRERFPWFVLGRDLPAVTKRFNPAKWALLRWRAATIAPRVSVNDEFFGVMYSGVLSKRVLMRLINGMSTAKAIEICVHPGFPAAQGTQVYTVAEYNAFISSPARQAEHDLLVDGEIAMLLKHRGLTLRAYDGKPKRLGA